MARITLSSHWKFQRLARALGSKVLARGILETLWEPSWVAGDAYCGTSEDIEALCEWKGEAGALTAALLMAGAKGAGFIEPYAGKVRGSERHYQIHDFFHHCPEYVKKRRDRELDNTATKVCVVCGDDYFSRSPVSQVCGDRCRQRLSRERKDVSDPETLDAAPETLVGHSDGHTSVTPRHGQSQLVTALTLTHTVQKSVPNVPNVATAAASSTPATATAVDPDMEGDDVSPSSSTVPAPLRATKKAPTPVDTSPVVLAFPVTGEGGPVWYLREAQVTRWTTLYPSLDVLGEARRALAWIEADPMRRKTAGGMTKCLVSWLNRSNDKPHARGPALITGSLKTAGNQAALEGFLRGRNALD